MMKQSKNKKGRLAKSTLSVILAASMVMTSSSFVWAGPEPNIISEANDTQNTLIEIRGIDNELVGDAVQEATLEIAESNFTYNGEEQIPEVQFLNTSKETIEMALNTDYTVSASNTGTSDGNSTDAGIKTLTVTLNEEGKKKVSLAVDTITYTITKAELTASSKNPSYPYSGADIFPEIGFGDTVNDETLTGEDYSIEKQNTNDDLTNPGAKKVNVTLNESGDIAKNYTFAEKAMTQEVNYAVGVLSLTPEAADLTYNGKSQDPQIIFSAADDTIKLVEGRDYTVKVDDESADAGDRTATISLTEDGKKLYTLAKDTVEYTIAPLDLSKAGSSIRFEANKTFVYDGTEQIPSLLSATAYIGGVKKDLVLDTDFELVKPEGEDDYYEDASDEPKTIAVEGKGNFTGKIENAGTYVIEKAPFNTSTVDVPKIKVEFSNETVSAGDLKGTLKVKGTDIELAENTNYTVSFEAGKEKGIYDITFTAAAGSAKFKAGGTIKTTYEIVDSYSLEEKFAGAAVKANEAVVGKDDTGWFKEYTGDKKGFALEVTLPNGTGLKEEVDYTVEVPDAEDCVDAGTYDITITGKKGYKGESFTIPFRVTPKPLNTASISKSVSTTGLVGSGLGANIKMTATLGTTHDNERAQEVAVVVKDNGRLLTAGTDYSYTTDKTAGTICVTGLGNYTTAYGAKDTVKTFTAKYALIDQLDLNDTSITAAVNGTYAYTSAQIKPDASAIEIKEGSYKLKADKDYKIKKHEDNIYAGTAKIIVEGIGDYTGERVLTFTITGKALADAYEFNAIADVAYDGKDHKAEFTSASLPLVMVDKTTKKEVSSAVKNSVDVKYYRDGVDTKDFKAPGTITVEAAAKAGSDGLGYEGKISTTYNIVGQQIGAYANVEAIADQAYTGSAITPDVKVVSKDSKVTFVKDTDYTVSYSANTNVGTATVVILGIGKYSGQIAATFNITATDIKDAVVTVAEGTYTYNGKAQTPAVTVKLGDAVLSAADYDVAYAKNINAGTATVTVTGKGNCTGTPAAATFVIAKADQKLATSKTITDALKIRNTNANTYTLKVTGAGTKLSYKSSDTKIAAVNATGKISFKHVCGKATITVTAAADNNHNAATLKVAVTVKPATPKITIAARAKGFNAKATAVKDITGYQVGYSTDMNFAASKTVKKLVKTTKALNKNFSGLSAKKGYYVRVRAYKKVGSTVYWGNWTSKITTK